jgi:hypothetical protein
MNSARASKSREYSRSPLSVSEASKLTSLNRSVTSENLSTDSPSPYISQDLQTLQATYLADPQIDADSSEDDQSLENHSLLQVHDNYVVVEAIATSLDTVDDLFADLQILGLQQGDQYGQIISGLLPIASLSQLPHGDRLKFVRPAYRPMLNVGNVTSEADPAVKADLARSQFGLDGSGITVGILSDSFNFLGGAAADIASGDLPGPGNPFDRSTPVNVLLDDFFPGNIDEGRGIAQLIHDLAPGAELAFHTAFLGQASFANGILDLANIAGADVIVDDVIYFAEPMFQDGIIAQAVDEVVADGVAYFSSAGNSARHAYESAFTPSGQFERTFGGEYHDFDPGSGVDVFQSVTVPVGATLFVAFQWDSPFFSLGNAAGSSNDLDIWLLDANGKRVLAESTEANVGLDPLEILSFTNEGLSPTDSFNLAISKFAGPDADLMKYVWFGSSEVQFNEYDTASGSIYGHTNAAGATAVGAAFYQETPEFGQSPPLIEPFSSAGPTPILFTPEGDRLPVPEIRRKPEIVAPDGTNTTFFPPFPNSDLEGDGFPNFFGTSAAAPHAAAVAALMLDAVDGAASPTFLNKILETTALDMDDPATPGFDIGFDDVTGYGLIQADRAIAALFSGEGAAEPNDTLRTAIASGLNPATKPAFTLAGTIGDNPAVPPGADIDLIRVALQAGDRLTVNVNADQFGSPLDARLRLFDSTGAQLATSDDAAAPGESLTVDPYLDVTAETSGVYYIGIGAFDNEAYDPTLAGSGNGSSSGDYSVLMSVETSDDDSGDDDNDDNGDDDVVASEPNDTIPDAIATGVSATSPTFEIIGTIGDNPLLAPGLDADLFEIQLEAGAAIAIDVDTVPASGTSTGELNTILRIFDAAGLEIGFNDDGNAPDEAFSNDSYQIFTATTAGTYFLGLSDFNNDFYDPFVAGTGTPGTGNTGDYTLTLNALSITEPTEPNDSLDTAIDSGLDGFDFSTFEMTGIIGNKPLVDPGAFPGADVDLVRVDLAAGDRITVDIDAFAIGSTLEAGLRLFNEAGTEIAISDLTGNPDELPSLDPYLDIMVPAAGAYYVGISSFDNFDYNPLIPDSEFGFTTGYYELAIAII